MSAERWATVPWHRAEHNCNPPCDLMKLAAHAKARYGMTKRELLREAEATDEWSVNVSEEQGMNKAYQRDLLDHLHAHGCIHEFDEYEAFNAATNASELSLDGPR